jgi:hypothetical protein
LNKLGGDGVEGADLDSARRRRLMLLLLFGCRKNLNDRDAHRWEDPEMDLSLMFVGDLLARMHLAP